MNLTGIIAISGRPGLFKVIVQGKNNVIVESLVDKKRFPAYSTDRISALEDISIYTLETEKPLKEIFKAIHDKENGGETISHKEVDAKLIAYLLEILPNYDQEKVYVSDIKKIYQWYNLLHKSGDLKLAEVKTEEVSDETEVKPAKKASSKKKEDAEVSEKKTVSAKNTAKPPRGTKEKAVNPKGKDAKIKNTVTMSTQNNI
jgi:hypothetical protein